MRMPLTKLENITDYNNNPPNAISFMPAIASTSGDLHSEFVRLLFVQADRETDRLLAASGVQLPQHDRDQFHYRRAALSSELKTRLRTYSIKQVRYSGVNDWNTSIKHTPSHKQIRMMRLKTSQFIRMDQPTLSYRLPDHLSQFHRHISFFKAISHSSLNRLSQVY
jgi:hypothetical protein